MRYNPEPPSPKFLKACQALKKFIFEIGVHLIHIYFKQLVYYITHFYMIYTHSTASAILKEIVLKLAVVGIKPSKIS